MVGVQAAETFIEVLVNLLLNILDLTILAEMTFVLGVEEKQLVVLVRRQPMVKYSWVSLTEPSWQIAPPMQARPTAHSVDISEILTNIVSVGTYGQNIHSSTSIHSNSRMGPDQF